MTHAADENATEFALRGAGLDVTASSNGVPSVTSSGILQPGEYTLTASSLLSFEAQDFIGNAWLTSSFLGSFTFAPVPAPGAALVLAGALGFAARRRR